MNNLVSKITLSVLTLSLVVQTQTAKAGSRTNMAVATIGGAIIGGLIGSQIAQNFDDNDNRQAQGMWNQALNGQYSDAPYSFQGSQHRGRLIFTNEGYFDGSYCRMYRSEVWDSYSNTPMVTTGYVCRANDGSWFRKNGGEIQQSRPNRPDRGRQFDPPPMNAQQGGMGGRQGMPMNGGGGMPPQQQQQGFPQQGRQMGGPGMGGPNMGGNGPNRGFGSPGANYGNNGNYNNPVSSYGSSTSTGTVITNGDALPITGVN